MGRDVKNSRDPIGHPINVTVDSSFNGPVDEDLLLRTIVLAVHSYISQNSQTPLVSMLGDCLYSNINSSDSESQNLTGVAAAFTTMFDAVILATTSAQTQLPGFDTNATLSIELDVQRTITVIKLGDLRIIIALTALNACILLA
jgi:hypothetical protein